MLWLTAVTSLSAATNNTHTLQQLLKQLLRRLRRRWRKEPRRTMTESIQNSSIWGQRIYTTLCETMFLWFYIHPQHSLSAPRLNSLSPSQWIQQKWRVECYNQINTCIFCLWWFSWLISDLLSQLKVMGRHNIRVDPSPPTATLIKADFHHCPLFHPFPREDI